MEALSFLICVLFFIYVFADKFQEQTKLLLTKVIELLPTPSNFRIFIVITLLVSLIIIGLAIYFRYDSTNVLP